MIKSVSPTNFNNRFIPVFLYPNHFVSGKQKTVVPVPKVYLWIKHRFMTLFQRLLIAGMLFCLNAPLSAQCPPPNQNNFLALDGLAQIDSFKLLYPNCTDLPYLLHLRGGGLDSLSGLSNIRTVEGLDIAIFANGSNDLQGLNLERVNGHFNMRINQGLVSLNGLQSLTEVTGSFTLEQNQNLASLQGLENLHTIGGIFQIRGSECENLAPLSSLDSVYGLNIWHNYRLTSLTGLQGIEHLGGSLSIQGNYISNMQGLNGIRTVGRLVISENSLYLSSLSGLDSLRTIRDGWVEIKNNGKLTDCAIEALCRQIAFNSLNVTIRSNGSGCQDFAEVSEICADLYDLNWITGKAFADLNCNGVQDAREQPIADLLITDQVSAQPVAFTNRSGDYIDLFDPSIDFTLIPNTVLGFLPTPEQISYTGQGGVSVIDSADFAFCPDGVLEDISVRLSANLPPRPGFDRQRYLTVLNQGNTSVYNLDLRMLSPGFADALEYNAFSPAQLFGDSLGWSIDTLLPFETLRFRVFEKSLFDQVMVGDTLFTEVSARWSTDDQDVNPDNHIFTLAEQYVGSYDPNDKTPYPAAITIDDTTPQQYTVEYRIRFQNTGTFAAEFIEVLDTIQPELDLSSFKMIDASHDYEVTFEDERTISWFFPEIWLPDSTSNEPESHGFIRFSLATTPVGVEGALIENRCGIYFDFNPPIITNTAQTMIALPVNTREVKADLPIWLSPNPATDLLNATINPLDNSPVEWRIHNQLGQLQRNVQTTLATATIQLDIHDLTPGIYFLQATQKTASGVQIFIKR